MYLLMHDTVWESLSCKEDSQLVCTLPVSSTELETHYMYHLLMMYMLILLFSSSLSMLKTRKVMWLFQGHIVNNVFQKIFKRSYYGSRIQDNDIPIILCLWCAPLCSVNSYFACIYLLNVQTLMNTTDNLSNPIYSELLAYSCFAGRERVEIPRCTGPQISLPPIPLPTSSYILALNFNKA